MNITGLFELAWRDGCHAWRSMRRAPVFTATAVATLALAICGNTAMFTVIRAVLLNPLPYPHSEELVQTSGGATPARFAEMRAGARSFNGLGAYTNQESITLEAGTDPEVLKGARVSAGFLKILGVQPFLGRAFEKEDDQTGAPVVALISHDLWQRRFGGDPGVVGRTVMLGGVSSTVIGVLPPRFAFPLPGLDVWMTDPADWPQMPAQSRALSPFLNVFGRLRAGVRLEQAHAELLALRHQYALGHPTMLDAKPREARELALMKDQLVGSVRSMLWLLFGAVGFVLLIACANVASLLLSRAAARSREFAVRAALGSGRARLMGQLLVESVMLSAIGGAFGVGLAALLLRWIPSITSFELPRTAEIQLDWPVLGFAAALSVATGVLFGLGPSLGASRTDLIGVLRTSGLGASRGRGGWRLRNLLPVGQVALSTVLLIGSALLMQSIANLRHVDLGFQAEHLLTMRVSLPAARYDTAAKRGRFFEELIPQLEALPGVRGAAAGMSIPMTGYAGTPVQDAAKPALRLNERLIAKFLPVTPGYFQTFGIPLRRGRVFTEKDTADVDRVVVIDENLARRFWPEYPKGVDPVGQRLIVGGLIPRPAEIVGVVASVRMALENEGWPESVYLAFAQNAQPFAMVAVRTEGPAQGLARAVGERVRRVDRDQPLAEVRTMEDLVEEQVGQRRLLVTLLGAFALVALLLAAIGIYGVVAYSVTQRNQEVGIRRALGAQQGDILRMVLRQGFVLALAGVALGLGGAYGLTRILATLLFRVSTTDVRTFAGIGVVFLLVAAAASYLPARRASKVDPMAALRV